LLVLSQGWHGHLSMDGLFGVQKVHTQPTPRIGGVAIALGLVVVYLQAASPVQQIFGPMLLASVPAFAAGLAEDLTKRVGVLPRLLATMLSGGLAWWLTGVAMQDTGVLPLDLLLSYTPLAVLFTAFAVGCVAQFVWLINSMSMLTLYDKISLTAHQPNLVIGQRIALKRHMHPVHHFSAGMVATN
jgi:UDP-N-acetylmuramyl pentapeptide phosphotransferase/UDP-N-acetylglucosamine-1-phosphate transferase